MKNVIYVLIFVSSLVGCQKATLEPTKAPLLPATQIIVSNQFAKYYSIQLKSLAEDFKATTNWKYLKSCWDIMNNKAYSINEIEANPLLAQNTYFHFLFFYDKNLGTQAVLESPHRLKNHISLPNTTKLNESKIDAWPVSKYGEFTQSFDMIKVASQKDKKIMIDFALNKVDFEEEFEGLSLSGGRIYEGEIYPFKTTNGKRGFIKCSKIETFDVMSPITNKSTKETDVTLEICFVG